METLATSVTRFFLQKHYIEPDQAEWFQYGLIRRMIGSLTFLLLLPIGAIFVGWIGSFLYLYSFRFLRTRTGGYHAKTPHGCLLTSLGTMFAALTLAKSLFAASHRSCFVCRGLVHFCTGARKQRFAPSDSQ